MSCPSAAELQQHLRDSEPDDAIAAHVDGCARCRQQIELLRTLPSPPPGDAVLLPPDTEVGRYRILKLLGKGGMGVVYAAHDPELDRTIAIKVLGGDRTDEPETRARLQREGQALARLSHRNVVTVYDVGSSVHGVFVAMEMIEGETLREWLARPRSQEAILATFAEAGRGLAAAHRAGLVHRDFKPENVLIGRDGRVCVSDFGLARVAGSASDPDSGDGATALTSPITQIGAVPGTPAYMAPEQLSDGVVDVSSDIFSFCVVLWEALAGVSPFAGQSRRQLLAAIVLGRVQPGRIATVPRRVREVLRRGLSVSPDARPESMERVLAALAPRARSWPWLTAGALTLAGVVGLAAVLRPRPCDGSGFAAVWNPTSRATLTHAFAATGLPYAGDTAQRVAATLDAYAERWRGMGLAACQAARVRHEQSAELFDLRMQCLDERRGAAGALIELLAHADKPAVEHAATAVQSLEPLDACANPATLRAVEPPPRDQARAARTAELRRQLDAAESLERIGRFANALTAARPLCDAATALGYTPLIAKTLLLRGRLEMNDQRWPAARQTFVDAAAAALRGRDDRALAEALLGSVRAFAAGVEAAELAEATRWTALAAATIDRLGGDDHLRARLFEAEGTLYLAQHRFDAAMAVLHQSIALQPPNSVAVALTLNNLGVALLKGGRRDEAKQALDESATVLDRTLGPMHPRAAVPRYVLAELLKESGPLPEAEANVRRALQIYAVTLPPEHPRTLGALDTLGEVLTEEGRTDEALATLQHALSLRRPGDQKQSLDRLYLALALEQAGKMDQALTMIDTALEAAKEPAYRAFVLLARGRLRLHARLPTARHDYEAALAFFEHAGVGQEEGLAEALVGIGNAALLAREPRQALPPLERALALADHMAPASRAHAEFAMARALVDSGGDGARAASLATSALARWEPLGAWGQREAAPIRQWQREHAPH